MISEKPWSLSAVARLCLGVFASLCGGTFVAGILQLAKLPISDDQLQFIQTLVMVVAFQGAALIWIHFFLRESNMSWRDAFGLRPPKWVSAVSAGLIIGLLAVPALWSLQAASQTAMEWVHLKPQEQEAVQELQKANLPAAELVVFGAFTILIAPVAEEALFRGVLYPAIKQTGHPHRALWGTAVAFGVLHFNMASFVPLIFLAVLLALLYEATDTLLTPIATHAMFNAANFCYLVFSDPIEHLLRRMHMA